MSYVEKHLIEGESIVYETRLHWIILVAPVLLATLFVLTGVGMFILSSKATGDRSSAHEPTMILGGVFFTMALFFLVRGIVMRNSTEMTVTNRRVFVKVGLAARRTIELLLSRVESIGVQESAMGRVFGYGAVVIHGTGGTPETFNMIAHPLEFRTQVQLQIEKLSSK
jgi:uncharacterized membrane protein YdbT with pleckstrin-like domain